MVAECDPEGRQYRIFSEISDHLKDDTALNVAQASFTTSAGNPVSKKTTRGWHILVEWRDDSMSWHKLADIKESTGKALTNLESRSPSRFLKPIESIERWGLIIGLKQ